MLLRYKFAPGQVTAFDMDMRLKMGIAIDGRGQEKRIKVDTDMKMVGKYVVQSVDPSGDARATMTISRATMEVTGDNPMSYDSAKDSTPSDPNLAGLAAMLNVPIPVRISARGELLDADFLPVQAAARKMGRAALKQVDQATSKLVENSFVQLPEGPVKRGDTYDAGKITMGDAQMGTMSATVRYRVKAVSADGKQVVLAPKARFEMGKSGAMSKMKMKSNEVGGWVLFDVAKGNIDRSQGTAEVEMSMSEGGIAMDMTMAADIRAKLR